MKTHHGWLAIGLGFSLLGCNVVEVARAQPPLDPANKYSENGAGVAATGEFVLAAPLRKKLDDLMNAPLDLVLLSKAADRVYIMHNTGAGFGAKVTQEIDTIMDPVSVAAMDANDDGALDLVIASAATPPTVQVWTNNGSGVFTEEPYARAILPGAPTAVIAAQLDSDCPEPGDWNLGARADFAVVANVQGVGRIIAFRSAGGGRFLPHTVEIDRASTGTGTLDDDIDSGDVDGDKDIDIIIAASTARGGGVRVLLNQSSQGEFRFVHGGTVPVFGPKGPLAATGVRLARLDGGVAPDLIIATGGTPGMLVALNAGGFGANWRGFDGAWSDDPNHPAASALITGSLYTGGAGSLTSDVVILPVATEADLAKLRAFDNDTELSSSPVKFKFKPADTLTIGAVGHRNGELADVTGDAKPDLLLPDGYHAHQ